MYSPTNIQCKRQSLPAVSTVTADNFDEFSAADKVVAIAYVSSASDPLATEFATAADLHRDDFLFGQVTDEALIQAKGVTPPTVVVYRAFDEPVSNYPYPASETTAKDIADWIQDLAVPVIDEVSSENYAVYAQSSKPLAYLFLDPTAEDKEAQITAIKPIAAKYKSKMNFVWIDAIKFGDHAKALNLNEAKWPSFVIQDLEKQLKYPLDQSSEINPAVTEAWVEQYLDGSLVPALKSQPIPETQDESVFTLVGKQFDEVVFDDSKDVFVEFYATWYAPYFSVARRYTHARMSGADTASASSLPGTASVTTLPMSRTALSCRPFIFHV